MARVTKINVGGTNYDIAHEGELKNSGFEVVTSLPTTGLFEGREVMYQGIKYVYNNGWRSQYNPVKFANGVSLLSSTEELTNAATVIEFQNAQLYQIPELLNKSLFLSNNTNVVKQSDRLYELIDNETGDITVLSGLRNPVIGQTLRYTAINPSTALNGLHSQLKKNGSTYNVYCVNIIQNSRNAKAVYKIEYYIYTNVTGDGDYNNQANYEWKTVFEKELKQYSEVIYPLIGTVYNTDNRTYTYIYNVRVSVTPTTKIHQYDILIDDIDVLYYGGLSHKTPVYANRLINFDAVIEPTQTSTEFKSPLWLWQYLVQGVNWLKANLLPLAGGKMKGVLDVSSSGFKVATDSSWVNKDRAIPFSTTSDPSIIQWYSIYENKGLTYNPSSGVLKAGTFVKRGGTATQMLMADGSTKDISKFASSEDIPTQLPNPNPIIIKTTDGVSVRYDGSASGGVTLKAGDNAELTATQDSDDTMTVKFDAIVPQTLPNPNALNIMVLNSEGALLGSTILYDGVATKYFELIEGCGIELTNSNVNYGQAVTINLKQIAGTTLLGNANDTTGTPQAVTMAQLRTMLGSLTLNGTTVNLGDTAILPWYVDYNEVDYPARIRDHWLQIYRNGVWANLMYLGDILPTQVGQITSLDNLDWYNEQVSEYEVDSSTTTSILNGTTLPATVLLSCTAEQLTLNLYPISGKQYGKGSLDSLISDLQGKGFSVFAENDLDAILQSGSDYLVRIKISKLPTPKAIIECYVAR